MTQLLQQNGPRHPYHPSLPLISHHQQSHRDALHRASTAQCQQLSECTSIFDNVPQTAFFFKSVWLDLLTYPVTFNLQRKFTVRIGPYL